MNIQEREHWDYESGCSSELQNALARSRMERPIDNSQSRINALVALGFHVVAVSYHQFCFSTDAYLGTTTDIVGYYDTREQAENNPFYIQCSQDAPDELDVWIEPQKGVCNG